MMLATPDQTCEAAAKELVDLLVKELRTSSDDDTVDFLWVHLHKHKLGGFTFMTGCKKKG